GPARIFDTTGEHPKKIHRGQQLVIFGRYEQPGPATLRLDAKLTGADRTYSTDVEIPAQDTDHPEIERLWALAQIEQVELEEHIGVVPADEARDAITHLGVTYQIVTDHTSMLVLYDADFASRGIERRNQQRVGLEQHAQSVGNMRPVVNHHVDEARPMFTNTAPHVSHGGGSGGGAFDRMDAVAMGFALALLVGTCLGRKTMGASPRSLRQ